MDVAKFIRILGYIAYVILWSPVIMLIAVIGPIWMAIICIRAEIPVINGWQAIYQGFKSGITHDMNFIETGEW